MYSRVLAAACVLAATVGSASATPSNFNWSLSGDDPSFGIIGSGTLTASESAGQFTVDSISGEVSNSCTGASCVPQYRDIIGLLTPDQAYGGLSDIGGDNLIFPAPSSSFLDSEGIVFSVTGVDPDPCPFLAGCYMRIYAQSPGVYDLYVSNASANGINFTLTATDAVPEPSTWVMVIVGFAAVGFMMLRRKSKLDLTVA
jgi:hypothetical protein